MLFDLDNVPPQIWDLLHVESVREALAKADAIPRCGDCLPAQHLFPMIPEDPEMISMWIIVDSHNESCPTFNQRGEHFEIL